MFEQILTGLFTSLSALKLHSKPTFSLLLSGLGQSRTFHAKSLFSTKCWSTSITGCQNRWFTPCFSASQWHLLQSIQNTSPGCISPNKASEIILLTFIFFLMSKNRLAGVFLQDRMVYVINNNGESQRRKFLVTPVMKWQLHQERAVPCSWKKKKFFPFPQQQNNIFWTMRPCS